MPLGDVKIDNCSKERRAIIKQEMENLMKNLALKIYNKETNEELCRTEGSWLRIQLRQIYCTEGLSEQAQKSKGDEILYDIFKRRERGHFQLLQSELEKLKQDEERDGKDLKTEEEASKQADDGKLSGDEYGIKNSRLLIKEKMLMLKDEQLQRKEHQLKKKDQQLKKKEQQLIKNIALLKRYRAFLQNKKKLLKNKEKRLKEKEQEVKERELQLIAREQNLKQPKISSPGWQRAAVRPTYLAPPPVQDPFDSEEELNYSYPVPARRISEEENDDDLEEDEIAKAAHFARKRVDAQTPSRKSSVKEGELICRFFPDPVEPEFLRACDKLRNSFENASMKNILPGVVDIMFKAHLAYLKAVHDNSISSQIRDEFQQAVKVQKSKQYADGGILLSFSNLHHLLQMLSSQVLSVTKGRNQNKHIPYIRGVLMPEFLTRMVMSVYKINKDKATTKIKELSVHISNILFEV